MLDFKVFDVSVDVNQLSRSQRTALGRCLNDVGVLQVLGRAIAESKAGVFDYSVFRTLSSLVQANMLQVASVDRLTVQDVAEFASFKKEFVESVKTTLGLTYEQLDYIHRGGEF